MNEFTLPIEQYYENAYPLNNLSNFYFKFMQEHSEVTYNYYVINYKSTKRDTQVIFNFCQDLDMNNTSPWGDYLCTGSQYRCQFYLYYRDNEGNYQPYTTENFDYTEALNSCREMTGIGIQPTYVTNYASNLWENNYLNTTKWTTQEVEPSPSPSPEPEEPTTTQFSDINPYFWILPSFILMLIFMCKFLDKIFARGE